MGVFWGRQENTFGKNRNVTQSVIRARKNKNKMPGGSDIDTRMDWGMGKSA